jgi:HJR/Mrr/RecB family endonuclease
MLDALLNLFKKKCCHGVPEDQHCKQCEQARIGREAFREKKRQEAIQLAEVRKEAHKQELVCLHQLEHLQKMNPYEFEELILQLFENLGWRTEKTPKSGDGGIDGILIKGGEKTFIQCKKLRKGKVGEPVIRDLYGSVIAAGAVGGIVVTTSEFSAQAVDWAKGKPIELLGAGKLIPLIQQAFREGSPIPDSSITRNLLEQETKDPCPECGKALVLRKGKHGDFIGCSGFPTCRHTSELRFSGRRKKRYNPNKKQF